MRRKITLRIDASLLEEAGAQGAEEGMTVTAFMEKCLEAIVRERKAFMRARRRARARLEKGLDLQWTPALSRISLHDRARDLCGVVDGAQDMSTRALKDYGRK